MLRVVAILGLLLPCQVFACGSPLMFLASYWEPSSTLEDKTQLLDSLGCGDQVNYLPGEDDQLVARVLADAIESGVPRETIVRVLKCYRCVYGARHETAYTSIRAFIGHERFASFCRTDHLETLYRVSSPNGAVLRAGPGTDTARIDAIRLGTLVEVVADEGDWLKVSVNLYGEGYIWKALLTQY